MWTRIALKDYAKEFLRKHYWKAFVVCLIAALLSSGGSSLGNNNQNQPYYIDGLNIVEKLQTEYPVLDFTSKFFISPLLHIIQGASLILLVIFVVLLITVGFAIEVGRSRFFLEGFRGNARIGTLFTTFNRQEYMPIVKTIFLRNVYNILWLFLFIIPGIIKSYEYRFVPYILAEKTHLSANEIISKSREMTKGHKMDMFVLDVSFIGWYLLGAILCGIGVVFVVPYKQATFARLYDVLAGNDMTEYDVIDV